MTDENGNYEISVSNSSVGTGDDLFIRVYLKSKTSKVSWDLFLDCYSFDTDILDTVTVGSTRDESYYIKYNNASLHYKATSVHQYVVKAESFALTMGMPELDSEANRLRVVYPFLDYPGGICYGFNDLLYWELIGYDKFNSFDVIAHEYGHYVQIRMGIYGATVGELLCYDYHHMLHTDHFEDKDNKEYAMKYTWLESWASAFSVIVQHSGGDYDKTDIIRYPLENPYNPELWVSYQDFYEARGEAQEIAIAAMLWDLYDSTIIINGQTKYMDSDDTVAWGKELLWDLTTQSGTYTLQDFVEIIDTQRPDLRDDVGLIMSSHNISPELVVSNNSSSSFNTVRKPTISWEVNGSEAHPNNSFTVKVYNSNDQEIFSDELDFVEITDHDLDMEYTFSASDWSTIISNIHNAGSATVTLKIAVAAKRKECVEVLGVDTYPEDLISGPYYSNMCTITVNPHNNTGYQSINAEEHVSCCVVCNRVVNNSTDGHLWTPLDDDWVECMECGYSKRLGGLGPFIPVIRPGAIDPEEDEIE